MKILVIGETGQLSWELNRLNAKDVELTFIGHEQLDLENVDDILSTLANYAPDGVINAAAYTAVDLAESNATKAFLINAEAVDKIAEYCRDVSSHLVQISTDFVFDGKKSCPYVVEDAVNPVSVYGESKAKSEDLVMKIVPRQACVIRTSWLYSSHGNNFVKSMLKLMQSKDELGIIADQIGTPTYAKGLAKACISAVKHKVTGIHHYSDAGVASWYDFAVAIQELGIQHDLIKKIIPVKPITTQDYPTPAKRPSYSVLDKSTIKSHFPDIEIVHWRKRLNSMMLELKSEIV